MYPVWAAVGLTVLLLGVGTALLVGRMRATGLIFVAFAVLTGLGAVGMYVAAEARYADCTENANVQFLKCSKTVFGDPGPRIAS